MASIGLEKLRKEFGDLVAVDDLDLEIANGEFAALLGPSGCGKTTTLRMVAGLEEATDGEIVGLNLCSIDAEGDPERGCNSDADCAQFGPCSGPAPPMRNRSRWFSRTEISPWVGSGTTTPRTARRCPMTSSCQSADALRQTTRPAQ